MAKINSPRIKRKKTIQPTEFKAFLKFFPKNIKLLVQTYRFASGVYAKIGLGYYWEELFQLPANAVYKPEKGPPQILLFRFSRYATQGERWFGHFLPIRLGRQLLKLAESQQGLLFRQEDGSPFNIQRLNREFSKAAELAQQKGYFSKYRYITPKHIAVDIPQNVKFYPGEARKVTGEQIQAIKSILPPSQYRKAGRKRECDLQDILNALLAEEDLDYSRSELEKKFPAGKAALSQKRRWIDRKVWDPIQRILGIIRRKN